MSRSHLEVSAGVLPFGGMSTTWHADPRKNERLVNVSLDRDGAWRTCGGYEQVLGGGVFTQASVRSLHWFAQHQGGRQFLVFEYENSTGHRLAYVDFSSASVVTIEESSVRTPRPYGPHPGATYFEHADWLYVLNGYSAPIRWNGTYKVPVGFTTTPPSPTVGVSGYDQADADYNISPTDSLWNKPFQRGIGAQEDGADADASRFLVGYAITWVNDLGQRSERSPVVWVQGNNSDTSDDTRGKRSCGVVLPPAPENVWGVELWRTPNLYGASAVDSPPLYLVEQFTSGAELHHVDDTPDHELVLLLDEDQLGPFPARALFAVQYSGRLWVDDGFGIRYSAPGRIEQFPADNTFALGGASSGRPTALHATRGAVVVFKRRGVWVIYGDSVSGFRETLLSATIGCVAPRSVVEVPGMGLLFLSEDGPYLLQGALEDSSQPLRLVPLAEDLGLFWNEEVNRKALDSARSVLNAADREVWIQLPTGGDDRAKLGLVFHYPTGAWSLREDFPFSCFAESRDHRSLVFAGSWDTSSSTECGIHVYTRGLAAPQDSEVRSSWIRLPARGLPVRVNLRALNVGRALTFQHHVDREAESWSTASDRSLRQTDTERVRDKWGTGVWGTASWAPRVPISMNLSVYSNSGSEFQFRLVGSRLAVFAHEPIFTVPTDPIKRLQE